MIEYYRIPLYILLGILPSALWLFYYLKKDLHPEPTWMIIKVYFLGCLITVPVYLLQVGFSGVADQLTFFSWFASHPVVIDILKYFLVIALSEEFFKYVVVRANVMGSFVLDEPLDIMLYMVVAALGFASVENIFYLFSP